MDFNRNDSPNNNNNNNDGRKPGGNRPKGSIGTALLITLAIVLLVNWIYGSISKSQYTQTSFSDFLAAKDAGQLSEVEIQSDRIIYMTKEEAGKPAAMQKACYTGLPGGDLIALSEELDAMGVKVDKKIVEDNSLIMMILSYALMIGGLFLVMNLLTKRMGGDGMMGGFGKSKARVYMEKQTGVTFKDVAGQDEAKESLQEIIDFLHNPQKYTAIGAKLPKGALLVGSPGTGKTLLAKAVAGEANVPFFSISGSDFVEMFVGMGASRVRDLFQQAAKVAPCIIFIDEIDAVGRARDNRYGNNSEQEQTLNQLLSEIDGFEPSKGIVCLAATNRPEILDKALLRPGRFDRRIIVDKPNLQGRLDTLKVHTRKIRLSDDVDLRKIAQATAGAVGADLANLVNEAMQYGIDGINVDFEQISLDCGEHYIEFIRELSIPCRANGIVLSVDNYVPTGYTNHYNRKEQYEQFRLQGGTRHGAVYLQFRPGTHLRADHPADQSQNFERRIAAGRCTAQHPPVGEGAAHQRDHHQARV